MLYYPDNPLSYIVDIKWGLALTASFADSFFDIPNGLFSKWAADWPIRALIYWLYSRQTIDPIVHSPDRPFLRATLGPFVGESLICWLIHRRIIDVALYCNIKCVIF